MVRNSQFESSGPGDTVSERYANLKLTEALQAFETSALDVRLPAEAAGSTIVHRLLLHFLGLSGRCPREGRLRRPRTTEEARP